MHYVTSHKAWNYERTQLVAGIILLGASERQETEIHKTNVRSQDNLIDI